MNKNAMENEQIITALDIGSSKTVVLISRVVSQNEIELIGYGVADSRGIKNGAVTNIELTSQSIHSAVEEAELMAGVEVDDVILNITGKHLNSLNSSGVIAITNKERVIQSSDVYRVIEAARTVSLSSDQEMIHVLSREFKVDDQNGIKDPQGMLGVRLEADIHIITGSRTYILNMEKAIASAGLRVRDKVVSSLASSHSLLKEEEKDLGVAIVDIGAGIIDIIVYVDGGVVFSSTIILGGQHLTQDVSIGLKTPMDAAENLKKRYGTVDLESVDPADTIEVPSIGERPPRMVARKELAEIMEARMREMLELIDHELLKSGRKGILAGGVVFTGGGSLVDGLIPLAEEVIHLGVSIGYPKGLLGIADKISSPVFSTVSGLIQYWKYYGSMDRVKKKNTGLMQKIKSWVQENL